MTPAPRTIFDALAAAPVVLQNGDNHAQAKAQQVTVPCEIAGQFEKKNNHDWYTFTAKKGQVLTIDAFGERLGAPVDLYYSLFNDKGTQVTEQDENPEITANQLYTRTDDPPVYRFSVPADGEYKLKVSSKFTFVQAGPRYYYTVRIMPETPDFTLVAMPTSLLNPESVVVSPSSNQAYTVYVFRQGGFTGDITLSGDLPAGLSIRPQVIAGNQKQANLVVSAPSGCADVQRRHRRRGRGHGGWQQTGAAGACGHDYLARRPGNAHDISAGPRIDPGGAQQGSLYLDGRGRQYSAG